MGTRILTRDKDDRLIDIYEVSHSIFRKDRSFLMFWRRIITTVLTNGGKIEIEAIED